MALVWGYFIDLNSARTSNGFGANPLTFSEIAAWDALTAVQLTPHEVQAIKLLDGIYLNYQAKQNKAK